METELKRIFYFHPKNNISDKPSRRTRTRCSYGTTNNCYFAQKVDLIAGAILSLSNEDKIKYFGSNNEDEIIKSNLFNFLYSTLLKFFSTFIEHQKPFKNQLNITKTSEYIRIFLNQNGWNDEKINDFIHSIRKIYQILTGKFDDGYYQNVVPLKADNIDENYIKEMFDKSMKIPIALAFGMKGYGRSYYIYHWFTLYKGIIHGTFGNDPEFLIDYYTAQTSPKEFFEFLKAMKENTLSNKEIIKNYMKKIWLDPQHFRSKKNYDETRRRGEKEYSIDKINEYINKTVNLIYDNDYNIYEMKDVGESLKNIIEVFLNTELYKELTNYLEVINPKKTRKRSKTSWSETPDRNKSKKNKRNYIRKRRPRKIRSRKRKKMKINYKSLKI
tara:strand:+ start:659 stop:1816 length:1158 start_codon:yes stop_codon:yes gene_type:complete